MKKISLFLFTVLITLLSCSDLSENNGSNVNAEVCKPSDVFVYSGGNVITTRSGENAIGYDIPDNGCYNVWYFIRIDGNIPGEDEVNLPSEAYFPRTAQGKTMISPLNMGKVTANATWRSNEKFSKYLYSTDGSAVQSVIVQEPTIEELVEANKGNGDDFTGYINNKEKLHFIWYACKKQDADKCWHIDGILTSVDKSNISETKYGEGIISNYKNNNTIPDSGNVVRKAHIEFDIHQQIHNDWKEVKTTVHLRDTVTVHLTIPTQDITLDKDDFDIKVGNLYEYTEPKNVNINIDGNVYQLEITIEHNKQGIEITIYPNKEALIAARKKYYDGLTFEIHSYVKNEFTDEEVWNLIKQSKCTTSPYTDIRGQITSAIFE